VIGETPVCCDELMGLVTEGYSTRNVSPLAMLLFRCRRCERFQWRLSHAYPCLPVVGSFYAHLRELQKETAARAYSSR